MILQIIKGNNEMLTTRNNPGSPELTQLSVSPRSVTVPCSIPGKEGGGAHKKVSLQNTFIGTFLEP
jgi:hypothetical protein